MLQYAYHPDRPLSEEDVKSRKYSPEIEPVSYRLPDGYIIDISRDVRHANNDYLIDGKMQRTRTTLASGWCAPRIRP